MRTGQNMFTNHIPVNTLINHDNMHPASSLTHDNLSLESTAWIKHITPTSLAENLSDAITHSNDFANFPPSNRGQACSFLVKCEGHEVELKFKPVEQKLHLDAAVFNKSVHITAQGEVHLISNMHTEKNILFYMEQKIAWSENKPDVDSEKLKQEYNEALSTVREIKQTRSNLSRLEAINESLRRSLTISPTENVQINIINNDSTIGSIKNKLEDLLDDYNTIIDRFDFVSQGKPDIQHIGKYSPRDTQIIRNFMQTLLDTDRESYEKRFSNIDPPISDVGYLENIFLVRHKGEIIGMADTETYRHGSDKIAQVNSVVNGKYHGLNAGKALHEAREKYLIDNGYTYKRGCVYRGNEEQINRLLRQGWRETQDSVQNSHDELAEFWKALDPNHDGREPAYISDSLDPYI